MSIPAMQSALFGIRENLRNFEQTVSRIVRDAPGGDLAADIVDLKIAETGVAVNVAVVRSADEMAGTLLDLLA